MLHDCSAFKIASRCNHPLNWTPHKPFYVRLRMPLIIRYVIPLHANSKEKMLVRNCSFWRHSNVKNKNTAWVLAWMGHPRVQGIDWELGALSFMRGMAALFLSSCGTLGKSLHLNVLPYIYLIWTTPTAHQIAERTKYCLLEYLTCT